MEGSMAAHVPGGMAAPKTSSAEPSIMAGHSGLHWGLPTHPLPLWTPLEVLPREEELQSWTGRVKPMPVTSGQTAPKEEVHRDSEAGGTYFSSM